MIRQVIPFLGTIFLICLVSESLMNHPQRNGPHETQSIQNHKPSILQSMFTKARRSNIFRIFRASIILNANIRQNLFVLADSKIIMFGAFIRIVNVMLLYFEIRYGFIKRALFHFQPSLFFKFASGLMQHYRMSQRLRLVPESLIIPQIQSFPLPHTLQLFHNYCDEFSSAKLSRLKTLFNEWLISNYKYTTF